MKIFLLSTIAFLLSTAFYAQCPTFFISAPSGTVVGCNPGSVVLTAINTSSLTNVSYTWMSTSTGTQTGLSINAACPLATNVFTVMASAPSSTCISTQTFAISSTTISPLLSVSPSSRTITCNGSAASFTAITTPTTNVVMKWYNPGGSFATPTLTSGTVFFANAPGTYSCIATNVLTGCTSTQTISVLSNSVVPTITINAIMGTAITCYTPCLPFSISASAGPAPKTYTWTNLTTSVTTMPATGGYTTCMPGNYLAEFKDGNSCTVSQTLNISIDTSRTNPTAFTNLPSNSFTLNCFNPCLTASAASNPMFSASNYSWVAPPNLTISSNTVSVCLVNITSSTSPTSYTVLALNPNGCISRQKVNFYKDIFVPPYTMVFAPSAITCTNTCIAISPNSITSSTVPVTFTVSSPPPTVTATTSGFLFCTPGTYTMVYQNALNGCTATTSTIVPLNVTPPSTVAVPIATLCSSSTVNISSGALPSPFYIYSWSGPGGATISSPNGNNTAVNMVGTYTVVITNTNNGCTATNTVAVAGCTGINESENNNSTVVLWPNPNNGSFKLQVGGEWQNAELIIYNALGQKIHSQKLNAGNNLISNLNAGKGIYYYSVLQNNKAFKTGKLIIE